MDNSWARLSEHTKFQVIKWSYLFIVIAATITLSALVYYNQQLVKDIQQDRVQVAYNNCLDVNGRHAELQEFVDDQPGPTNPTVTKFLNILAPERNCVLYVTNLLGKKPNESG
jgi:hypothetical protein